MGVGKYGDMSNKRSSKLAWTVRKVGDYWYWYDWMGEASMPYDTEEGAWEGLDFYAEDYDRDWDLEE